MLRSLVLFSVCVALAFVVPGMAEPEPDSKVNVKIDPNDSKVNANVEVKKTEDQLSVDVHSEFLGPDDQDKYCCEVDGVIHNNGTTWSYGNGTECICMEGREDCRHSLL
ncbi:uncharacterized protein LOC119580859 isoform X2 [Penaeus monodon]|uniref:uncharacterized protein LOC119580859 isoform X2 n=1 Tax=Penaeus monodon TaxID=6687 RepID=UPI0018A7B987|nr:uncharacterized protein LOC119580859 isoform X2 [Penaeus monodon]